MKIAIVYRRPGDFHDVAEWFRSIDGARGRAEKLLADQVTKSVAIVEVRERAHAEVTWVR